MEAGKKAMEAGKETAANVGASAKSGMEKTKATVQEKGTKVTSHTNFDKNTAEQRKENRINAAELTKQREKEQNAANRAANTPGPNQMLSAQPGHGTGEPAGGNVYKGQPTGTTAQNPRSGAGNGGSYAG